ncbi:MAG: hypothetical protein V4753_04430 [Pseudomonadota bacterium]
MSKYSIYERAAILLQHIDIPAKDLAIALECSHGFAQTLRSLFNTCGGNPDLMQGKANQASRVSKARARMAA